MRYNPRVDISRPILRDLDTVAELRTLYRSAESRAARLRLLIEAGRDLSEADSDTLTAVLDAAAHKAALFAGYGAGTIALGADAEGVGLIAPGPEPRKVGGLALAPAARDVGPMEEEDREAFSMLCQLIASAIDRVGRDVERDHFLSLLRERERTLENVVARLFSAQEDERRRVSRDLHDGVAQTAGALFRQIEAQRAGASPEAVTRLAAMAQSLVRQLRSAIADLRPTALDDLGLGAAVAALAAVLSAEGFEVGLDASGPDRWPNGLETAFYRVAQEAMNNIYQHAGGPCRVRVELDGDPERCFWRLVVRDWGRGFGERTPSMGGGDNIGLEVMRERMIALGGRLEITHPPGGGVMVSATLEMKP